jgi:hypothetical protein
VVAVSSDYTMADSDGAVSRAGTARPRDTAEPATAIDHPPPKAAARPPAAQSRRPTARA